MDARTGKVCLGSLILSFLLVLPVAFAVTLATNDEYRTWTDTSGKYRVEASMVSQSESHVTLLNRDGKEISVAKEKLCADDLAYLKAKANESAGDPAKQKEDKDGLPSNSTDASMDHSNQTREETQPEQNEIKKLAESFFEDLRTKDRSVAKSMLTAKAQTLVDEAQSALPHLPPPDIGTNAIRARTPSIRKEVAAVIVNVKVAKRFQKTLLEFKREDDQWRVHAVSASRGDVEATVDFESPFQPGNATKDPRESIGGNEIEITGVTLDGRRISLSDYKGKVVLVDFWATWCGPCIQEIPNVYENYMKYHSMGFEVIAVSLDRDMSDLQQFMLEKNPPWIVLADRHPTNTQSMATKFGISAIPTMFLIGKDGKVLDTNCRGQRLTNKLAEIFGR